MARLRCGRDGVRKGAEGGRWLCGKAVPLMRLCTGLLEGSCRSGGLGVADSEATARAPPLPLLGAGGGAVDLRPREPDGAMDTRFSRLGLATTGDFMSSSNSSRVTSPSPLASATAAEDTRP